VLRFIEETFGLPNLGNRDVTANDMMDSFDFTQDPNSPLILTPRACPVVNKALGFGEHLIGSTTTTSFHPVNQNLQIFNYNVSKPLKIDSVKVQAILLTSRSGMRRRYRPSREPLLDGREICTHPSWASFGNPYHHGQRSQQSPDGLRLLELVHCWISKICFSSPSSKR